MTRVGGLRTLPVECITYIKILPNGVIICFFQAKYLIFVSSLRFRSIFKKWDNFLEISLNEKQLLFFSIYGLFYKYDIFLYRIVMLRGFSLQRTLVPFVVKKINLKPMNSCLLHKISLFICIVNRATDTT